ncbi:hypothetical protein HanIR_Chr04g0188441 [Helianthus annuus]|nr:hypothetical protein HanIR_Chr04g0188441 [Helianthus annuus]
MNIHLSGNVLYVFWHPAFRFHFISNNESFHPSHILSQIILPEIRIPSFSIIIFQNMNEFPCLMMIGCINPRSINPYVFCRFFTSIRLLIDLLSSSVSSHRFGCQSICQALFKGSYILLDENWRPTFNLWVVYLGQSIEGKTRAHMDL